MDITSSIHANRSKAFLVGDHASYQTQTSRQLLKLRRRLHLIPPKNQRNTKRSPLTAQQIIDNHGFVQLHILLAERAWAHAIALKNTHTSNNSSTSAANGNSSAGITGPARSHILSRLRKAVVHAQTLVSLLRQAKPATHAHNISDNDLLEAHAYALYLHATLELERHLPHRFDSAAAQISAWKPCLESFSTTHVIYSALLHDTKKDVFKETLATDVDPGIRYASYQSKIPRTVAVSSIAKHHFRSEPQDAVKDSVLKLFPDALTDDAVKSIGAKKEPGITHVSTSMTWRGRMAPITDAAIGQALAAREIAHSHLSTTFSSSLSNPGDRLSALQKDLAASYDPLLTSAQDTADAVRSAITEQTREGASEADSRIQDLRVQDLAANYALVSCRIGRNRALISSFHNKSAQDSTATPQKHDSLDDGLHFYAQPPSQHPSRKAASQVGAKGVMKSPKSESPHHALSRLATRVALYDSIVQSIQQLAALPGAARDVEFTSELAGAASYFAALRCINIAYSYRVVAGASSNSNLAEDPRTKEKAALALFAKAWSYVSAEGVSLPTSEESFPTLSIDHEQLAALRSRIRDLLRTQRGLVALQCDIPPLRACKNHPFLNLPKPRGKDISTSKDITAAKSKPLISLLDDPGATLPTDPPLVDLRNIVPWPPNEENLKVEAVPVKPIFLDIAYNYIKYPHEKERDSKSAKEGRSETKEVKEEPKKKGWFGFGRS